MKNKELRKLKMNSDFMDFMEVYNYDNKLVGRMEINKNIKINFIKILMIFPLKDKKLKYFLSLSPKSKVGYMSKYMMKIARKIDIPQQMIEQYYDAKEQYKLYKSFTNKLDKENTDMIYLMEQHKYEIKRDVYKRILNNLTNDLASIIFHYFDNIRKIKLEKILKNDSVLE